MAAVLACGPGAVLSHRDATALLGLRSTTRRSIDVTTPRQVRRRDRIDVHRGDTLRARDVIVVDGIPCTSVARTLLDLAEVVSPRQLERAFDRADVLRLLDVREVDDVLSRANGRRGAPLLRRLRARDERHSTLTRRELEELFLALCDRAGLERPRVNEPVYLPGGEPTTPDFVWPAQRLLVETDGRETHLNTVAFEEDRRRDQRALMAGWRVARFTWRQVTDHEQQTAATLRALLRSG